MRAEPDFDFCGFTESQIHLINIWLDRAFLEGRAEAIAEELERYKRKNPTMFTPVMAVGAVDSIVAEALSRNA